VARPTEPRDSYASGIRIPHSSPSVKSNSRSDKQVCYRQASPDTRNKRKRDATLQHDDSVFGPQQPQKTYTRYKTTRSCRLGRRQLKGGGGAEAPSDISTTPGPSPRGSSPGIRLEQTARPIIPRPRPAVPRGHHPGLWPRQLNSGVGPASGRPVQALADQVFFLSQLYLCPC
jgi:hypothetical protein